MFVRFECIGVESDKKHLSLVKQIMGCFGVRFDRDFSDMVHVIPGHEPYIEGYINIGTQGEENEEHELIAPFSLEERAEYLFDILNLVCDSADVFYRKSNLSENIFDGGVSQESVILSKEKRIITSYYANPGGSTDREEYTTIKEAAYHTNDEAVNNAIEILYTVSKERKLTRIKKLCENIILNRTNELIDKCENEATESSDGSEKSSECISDDLRTVIDDMWELGFNKFPKETVVKALKLYLPHMPNYKKSAFDNFLQLEGKAFYSKVKDLINEAEEEPNPEMDITEAAWKRCESKLKSSLDNPESYQMQCLMKSEFDYDENSRAYSISFVLRYTRKSIDGKTEREEYPYSETGIYLNGEATSDSELHN